MVAVYGIKRYRFDTVMNRRVLHRLLKRKTLAAVPLRGNKKYDWLDERSMSQLILNLPIQ